jgi:pectate lyase
MQRLTHLSTLFAFTLSITSGLAACSADTPDESRLSGHASSSGGNVEESTGGTGTSSAVSTAQAPKANPPAAPTTTAPAAAPTTTTAPTTTPPPAAPPQQAGICSNPTCTGANGQYQCTATDSNGDTVEMDCQGGVCSCYTGDLDTTDFYNDNPTTIDAVKGLYFSNCQCY